MWIARRVGAAALTRERSSHSIAQAPGGPPQRPHIGASELGDDFPPSLLTAKTLSARAVLLEPHSGHFTVSDSAPALLIVRTSFSNFAWQLLHAYS
jgi:hypothetical protein